jgi:hypothetical protein
MLDLTKGKQIWPSGAVTIVSRDLARQSDILDSLTGIRWNLVLADEAHSIGAARGDALRRIGMSAERIILSTIAGAKPPQAFPEEDSTVVEWQRSQVVDHDGKPLYTRARPILHQVTFTLSPAELSVAEAVGSLYDILAVLSPQQRLIANVALRAHDSSPAALETLLRGLAEKSEARDEALATLETAEGELPYDGLGRMDQRVAEKATEITERALHGIEAIQNDSKLEAFVEILSECSTAVMAPSQVCVLTEFMATLYYIAAEIEARGLTWVCDMVVSVRHGAPPSNPQNRR